MQANRIEILQRKPRLHLENKMHDFVNQLEYGDKGQMVLEVVVDSIREDGVTGDKIITTIVKSVSPIDNGNKRLL